MQAEQREAQKRLVADVTKNSLRKSPRSPASEISSHHTSDGGKLEAPRTLAASNLGSLPVIVESGETSTKSATTITLLTCLYPLT